MNEARIKLAEAMGYVGERLKGIGGEAILWSDPDAKIVTKIPDPFTDANDDYAVLVWMRDIYKHTYSRKELESFLQGWQWKYQIGNYARAACKVLGVD